MSTLNHLSHLKVALLARLALASVDHQRLQLRHAEGDDHRLVLLIVSHHCRIDIDIVSISIIYTFKLWNCRKILSL